MKLALGTFVVVGVAAAALRYPKLNGDYRRGDQVRSLHAHAETVSKGMGGFVLGNGRPGYVRVYFQGGGVHEVSVHRTSRPHEFGSHAEDHHGGGLRKGDAVRSLTAVGQAWHGPLVEKDAEGHVVGPGAAPNTVTVDFGHTSGSVSLDHLMPVKTVSGTSFAEKLAGG